MGLKRLSAGDRIPDEINVVIEIPSQSNPVKYEVDKVSGTLFVDRFMSTSMRYPCDYGYIPDTLSEDNDPVDVLVICPFPLMSGSVIRCRPIGMLHMTDEQGSDSKLLAVPVDTVTPLYKEVQKPEDVSPLILNAILHFFMHYKDLEEGKWVKVHGWLGPDAAHQEILDSIARYQQAQSK